MSPRHPVLLAFLVASTAALKLQKPKDAFSVKLKRTHDFLHTFYYGSVFVGGYPQLAIMDSGSWELVLPASCEGLAESDQGDRCCAPEKCPWASYRITSLVRDDEDDLDDIPFLSGSCTVRDGTDTVVLGGKAMSNIPVRTIVDHEIDFYKTSHAQAIFGLAPRDNWGFDNMVLGAMGVDRFTLCLDPNEGDEGVIWFNSVPGVSSDHWMVTKSNMMQFWGTSTSKWRLAAGKSETHLGCETEHCGVFIDTGTPLMNLPEHMYQVLQKKLNDDGVKDCSDLSKFPTLKFMIGDHELELGPDSYLADGGVRSELLVENLQFPPMPMSSSDELLLKSSKPFRQCVMLFEHFAADQHSARFGKLITLGLLTFSNYMVQFDLKAEEIRFQKALVGCEIGQKARAHKGPRKLQTVDLDMLNPSLFSRRHADVQSLLNTPKE